MQRHAALGACWPSGTQRQSPERGTTANAAASVSRTSKMATGASLSRAWTGAAVLQTAEPHPAAAPAAPNQPLLLTACPALCAIATLLLTEQASVRTLRVPTHNIPCTNAEQSLSFSSVTPLSFGLGNAAQGQPFAITSRQCLGLETSSRCPPLRHLHAIRVARGPAQCPCICTLHLPELGNWKCMQPACRPGSPPQCVSDDSTFLPLRHHYHTAGTIVHTLNRLRAVCRFQYGPARSRKTYITIKHIEPFHLSKADQKPH